MKSPKLLLLALLLLSAMYFYSCGADTIINQIVSNDVAAKDRLDAATTQAKNKYGVNTQLVLIFGKNVKSNGKTDISALSAITNPDSIGAWLYIYRVPGDTASASLRVYTPDPTPGTSDCIELTQFFSVNTIINLIQDSAAKSIVSSTLNLLENSNIGITTSTSVLINSDAALNLANSTSPVIKFNSSYIPSASTQNGSTFFSSGTNQSRNMFLIPAAGALHLPTYITNLIGFPNDLWVVNFRKTDSSNQLQTMTLGTVVTSGATMAVPAIVTSPVINLSSSAQ